MAKGVIGGSLVSGSLAVIGVRPMGLRYGMGSISLRVESFVAIDSPNVRPNGLFDVQTQ